MASLGVFPSTPVAFLQAEGGSMPAVARLAKRQAVRYEARHDQGLPASRHHPGTDDFGEEMPTGPVYSVGPRPRHHRKEQSGPGPGLPKEGAYSPPGPEREGRGKREEDRRGS